MPDIHCKHCGEPWDLDSLHDMLKNPNDYEKGVLPFPMASKRFSLLGCGAFEFGLRKCDNGTVDPQAAIQAEANQIMSEHADDWIE
jgi:hypothetical protein